MGTGSGRALCSTHRWRGSVLVALTVLLTAVPARATDAAHVRGVAGSWGVVRIGHDTVLDWRLREVQSLTADRGPFVGFALVGGQTVLSYVQGRHDGRGCTFAQRCEVNQERVAAGQGPSAPDHRSFFLPAGSYRLVLLGAPHAVVDLRSTLPFLSAATQLPHRGRVQLEPLASTAPRFGDRQPRADGAAGFEANGDAITGLQWRVDGQDLRSLNTSICIGEGMKTVPPQSGLCDPNGTSEGTDTTYPLCPTETAVSGCLPGTGAPVSITRGLAAFVPGGSHASYAVTVQALKSRVFGWAWNIRLG